MSSTGKYSATFNTSVVIVLSQLGYLEDAVELFREVELPLPVVEEVGLKKDSVYFRLKSLINRGLLKVEKVEKSFVGLGTGESSVIYLALIKGKVAVLDDKKARKLARQLEVPVIGTLSILKGLRKKGVLKETPSELYTKLIRLKFRVDRKILEKVLENDSSESC